MGERVKGRSKSQQPFSAWEGLEGETTAKLTDWQGFSGSGDDRQTGQDRAENKRKKDERNKNKKGSGKRREARQATSERRGERKKGKGREGKKR